MKVEGEPMTENQLKWSRTVLVGIFSLVATCVVATWAPDAAKSEAYLCILSIMGVVAGRQSLGKGP